MICMIRVDDRLLHGQIICAWVPYVNADSLIVASDEAAGDALAREIISSCACEDLRVHVLGVDEAARGIIKGGYEERRYILIVGALSDAMRLYEDGMRFAALNIGNIHHDNGGRRISGSVIINSEDEEILQKFDELGVKIDIRDVPASAPAAYSPRGKNAG